jgi:hypothetical protein
MLVLNTKNKAVACLQVANELCKDVKVISNTANPKPWNTDKKVKIQAGIIRKVFNILNGGVDIAIEDSEPAVACLQMAYNLCDSLTMTGSFAMSSSNTDEGVIRQAEVIKSIFDILHNPQSDFDLFS